MRLREILIQQIEQEGSVSEAISIRVNPTKNKLLEVISIGSFGLAAHVSRSFAIYIVLLEYASLPQSKYPG